MLNSIVCGFNTWYHVLKSLSYNFQHLVPVVEIICVIYQHIVPNVNILASLRSATNSYATNPTELLYKYYIARDKDNNKNDMMVKKTKKK